MKKVKLGDNSGMIVENDGGIHLVNSVDLTAAKEEVKRTRELYHHDNKREMWLVGEMPYAVVDHIRIQHKIPNTVEGRNEAIEIVKKMFLAGQLKDFMVHGQ